MTTPDLEFITTPGYGVYNEDEYSTDPGHHHLSDNELNGDAMNINSLEFNTNW